MKVLVDTGPLVAMINRRDTNHGWATDQSKLLGPLLFTCEAVLTEAHFLLRRTHDGSKKLNKLVADGGIILAFSYTDHIDRVNELMDTYANVPMSFADACLVRMAERYTDGQLFTTDGDFRIYRKNQTEPLNVIMPY